jgi:DNA-binding transcriptional MerR regulator
VDNTEGKRLYSVSDVARLIGKSQQTIKRWAKQNKIPQPKKLKINGRLVFTEEQISDIKKFATETQQWGQL